MMPLRAAATTLLLLAALALPASSLAQIIDRFGVKAGVVSTGVSSDYSDGRFRSHTGMAAYAFTERRLLSFLSLVGEVGYVQRGFSELSKFDPTGREVNTRLDYVTVPVMAKFGYDFALASPYVMTGPRIDVLLDWESTRPGPFPAYDSPYAEEYNSFATGGTVALGIATPKRFPIRLLLEGRYEMDFTDSFAPDPYDMRNRAFSLIVGVAL